MAYDPHFAIAYISSSGESSASAFHSLALLADRSPHFCFIDVLQRVGNFARRVAHVDRYLADLRRRLDSNVAECLYVVPNAIKKPFMALRTASG